VIGVSQEQRRAAERSNPAHEKQNDQDDHDDADDPDTAMAVTIAVAAEATTKAANQEDHEDDDQYEPDRHGLIPLQRGSNISALILDSGLLGSALSKIAHSD
jgi:hypothetical protein